MKINQVGLKDQVGLKEDFQTFKFSRRNFGIKRI